MNIPALVDPVCLVHGLPLSQHNCLYCCLCYMTMTPEECNVTEDGSREDVCVPCATAEKLAGARRKLGDPTVFLDWDGVWMLRDEVTNSQQPHLAPIRLINRILTETSAIPVAISTHRNGKTQADIASFLKLVGFVNVEEGCVMVEADQDRDKAIMNWLAEHQSTRHWIVLDDEARHYDHWSDELKQHLVLTCSSFGVVESQVPKAIALLRGETPPDNSLKPCDDSAL